MLKPVIVDTSVFVLLDKIDELDVLRLLYGEVYTTIEVVEEFGDALPNWVTSKTVKNRTYQTLLETQIDRGEASVIALAVESTDALLILDDLKARKLVKRLNLKLT